MKLVKLARSPSYFEKIIVFVGIFILVFGYILMQKMLVAQTYMLSWEMIQAVFLWLLMVIFLIILAVAENIKEELKIELQLLQPSKKNKTAKRKIKKIKQKKIIRKKVKK